MYVIMMAYGTIELTVMLYVGLVTTLSSSDNGPCTCISWALTRVELLGGLSSFSKVSGVWGSGGTLTEHNLGHLWVVHGLTLITLVVRSLSYLISMKGLLLLEWLRVLSGLSGLLHVLGWLLDLLCLPSGLVDLRRLLGGHYGRLEFSFEFRFDLPALL